jgi:predicted Zn-dependent protease
LFTREQSLALAQQVQGYMRAIDDVIGVSSAVGGGTDFALGEIQRGSDYSQQSVHFGERLEQRRVTLDTDRVDESSLRAAVGKAEALADAMKVLAGPEEPDDPLRPPAAVNAGLWSDSSFALSAPEARFAAISLSLGAARKAGLVAAGGLSTSPRTSCVLTKDGHYEYGRKSTYRYTVAARTPDGTGSGWAVSEGEDWSKVDVGAVTDRAIDLALRSRNPVAIEPGRYTVVMTPEACSELVSMIVQMFDGREAESDATPFSLPGGATKLGLKVLDERISISADPMDAEGGFLPFAYSDGRVVQYVPVTWIERGVLKMLSYPTRAAAAQRGLEQVSNPNVIRVSSGPTSIEEMIASTTRGIYVTRFSNVSLMAPKTMYMSGVTRDGTFLIEHGKITKAIKNMRFEDSPFFFLNNLEAIGTAKRVTGGHVMPPVMVRDFAFTSLTDAI